LELRAATTFVDDEEEASKKFCAMDKATVLDSPAVAARAEASESAHTEQLA